MDIEKIIDGIREKYSRMDADDETGGKKAKSGLGTRLPYALCKEVGIDTTGMTPSEAWAAYMEKTGSTPSKEIKKAASKSKAGKATFAKKKESASTPSSEEWKAYAKKTGSAPSKTVDKTKAEEKIEKPGDNPADEKSKANHSEAANKNVHKFMAIEHKFGHPLRVKDEDGNVYRTWFGEIINTDTGEVLYVTNPDHHEKIASLKQLTKEELKDYWKDRTIDFDKSAESDFREYFAGKHGISFTNDVFKKCTGLHTRKALKQIDTDLSNNPIMSMKKIDLSNSGVACYVPAAYTFGLNPSYFKEGKIAGYNSFQAACDKMAEIGHWPKNTTIESVMHHEFAHAVTGFMVTNGWKKELGKAAEYFAIADLCSDIRSRAYDDMIADGYASKHKLTKAIIEAGISKYAADNPAETIAEACADVFANGENAKPLSKYVHRELKKRFKEQFGEELNI